MKVKEAIFRRRATRSYSKEQISKEMVNDLLLAAVQAPSAMNSQPWAFVVIQDPILLPQYAMRAKEHILKIMTPGSPISKLRDSLSDGHFEVFYHAPTLIVIYATQQGSQAMEDCCLAAQNLMLTACEMGLGTCPIGLARPWLDLQEVKLELGVPESHAAVLPIVVGRIKEESAPVTRNNPKVICWK